MYAEQQSLLQLREAQAVSDAERDKRNANPDYKATEFVSGRMVDTRRQRKVRDSSDDGAMSEASDGSFSSSTQSAVRSRISTKPGSASSPSLRGRKALIKGSGGAGMGGGVYGGLLGQAQDVISGSPAHSRREIQKRRSPTSAAKAEEDDEPGRKGFFCPGGGYLNPNVLRLLGGRRADKMLDPKAPGPRASGPPTCD